MDTELTEKILNFVEKKGKVTSVDIAAQFGLDNKRASELMCKLHQRWMLLAALGLDGRSRVYGLRNKGLR